MFIPFHFHGLAVYPLQEVTEDFRLRIVELQLDTLSLRESAVESGVEVRRVVTEKFLVDVKRLCGFVGIMYVYDRNSLGLAASKLIRLKILNGTGGEEWD